MLGQTPLQVDTAHADFTQDVASGRRTRLVWFLQGGALGLAVLMLIALASPLASHPSADPTGLVADLATMSNDGPLFAPSLPVAVPGIARERYTAWRPADAPGVQSSGRANLRRPLTVNMGNVKELRNRIESVKNTEKITSAMKLVAAAKVRRAQDAVLKARPFSETLDQILAGLVQRLKVEKLDIPLMEAREVKKVGLVVFTGDRGLCGGYNANAIKMAEARIAELKSQGIDSELITVGSKAISYFGRRETPVRMTALCTQSPTAEQANGIAEELLNSYNAGELDRIELVYTKFLSMIASEVKVRTLVPLSPSGIESEEDEIFKLVSKDGDFAIEKETKDKAAPKEWVTDMIFEQEPEVLLNALLPLYLNGQILKSLQESVASELASRMSAMQAASDNAKTLKKDLSQVMNRARQAQVTQEIMEIVAGAAAGR